MRKFLKNILRLLAKRAIHRYKPIVIGVTGSVGKTTAKEAIYSVLGKKFWVRKNDENFNNDIGVPMTVLGISPRYYGSKVSRVLGTIGDLASGFWLVFGPFRPRYPEVLILELAADRPGDIEYLVDIVKPRMGVVTAVGDVPVHVEFYSSPQSVAKEKSKLIEALPTVGGLAVLNYDDQTVLDMKEKSNAEVMTFGFSNLSDFWISDTSYFMSDDGKNVGGLSFKINHGSTFVPAKINNLIGMHQLYGVLASAVIGSHLGINLINVSEALENIDLPKGRMRLMRGIKNTAIIDDTYNASPLSVHAALDTLRDFSMARRLVYHQGRKIAVLGDMKELGKYEIEAHRAIGNVAGERADILITVGAAAKFIADSAANQLPKENILSFNTSEDAKMKVQEIIQEGDVVLVKGSRSMKMEKIVDEIKEM
ncbi:MAG: UDP-N-acetylmuramoyl-tripeptide--D-alanyl-D-alanine ligase [Candidatus Paceibacterota bacterium]